MVNLSRRAFSCSGGQRNGVFDALGQRILFAKQEEQQVEHGEEVYEELEGALTDIESLCGKELAALQEGT